MRREGINEAFFQWQSQGGWAGMRRSSHGIRKLESWFNFMTDVFLNQVGMHEVRRVPCDETGVLPPHRGRALFGVAPLIKCSLNLPRFACPCSACLVVDVLV